jgi:two-component system LytT family response regulator
MHVLIADDEALARAHLRSLLVQDPDVTDIAECRTGAEAVSAILARRPDLVLLDIEMPELDGFGVVRTLGVDRMPAVIFVTAHHHYATRAAHVPGVDFILKPVWEPYFTNALGRAKARLAAQGTTSGATDAFRSSLSALMAQVNPTVGPRPAR